METKSWFFKRGYPKGLVQKELRKVKFSDKVGGKQKKKKKIIPFAITYQPILKSIGNI